MQRHFQSFVTLLIFSSHGVRPHFLVVCDSLSDPHVGVSAKFQKLCHKFWDPDQQHVPLTRSLPLESTFVISDELVTGVI